jgi:hypothetical protein
MLAKYPAFAEEAMRFTFSALNERQRRLFAATEAIKLGHGGIAYVSQLLGCHRRTVERGLAELNDARPLPPPAQARKKGVAGSAA